MKAVAMVGSRNPQGQTMALTETLLGALAAHGWESETFLLTEMQIERCRQCNERGWGICREEGRCVIEDDFAALAAQIKAADAVVFATPIYFGDLSESMRAFLDRLRRTSTNEQGKVGLSGKRAVGICLAGGGGAGAPNCLLSLERVLNTCGFNVVDLVPARRQNLELKRRVLALTGEWLATQDV